MGIGIFGKLDSDTIPDNPFFVAEGEYRAIVTDAFFQTNKKGKNQFVIVYTISDEDSEFFNQEVRDWFDHYPDIDDDTFEKLSGAEKQAIRRSLSAIKRRLCGTPGSNRRGLGVDPTDLDEDWDPKSLKSIEVDVAVVNSGSDNEYSNVRWANVIE